MVVITLKCEDPKAEFAKVVADAGAKAVIVDYSATWCGPCKQISPIFKALSDTYTSIVFVKIDVDEAEELAADHGISAMPTFKVFKNGAEVDEMVGASKDKLTALIEKYQ